MNTYDKIRQNIKHLVDLNEGPYVESKKIFSSEEHPTIKRFNEFVKAILKDIRNKTDVAEKLNLNEEEVANLYCLALHYRLVRNLITIEKLIFNTLPQDHDFDAIEFSLAIILRSSLLDCEQFYKVRETEDAANYLRDNFTNFSNSYKGKIKKATDQIQKENFEQLHLFFNALNEKLKRDTTNDTPAMSRDKLSTAVNFFDYQSNECKELYNVYSKYEHFGIYELSILHVSKEDRIELIHQAILLQVPVLAATFGVLLGGYKTKDEFRPFAELFNKGIIE